MKTVTELLQPVEKDLEDLVLELKNLIGAGHPILQAAAEHLFAAGGKRLRPGIVLLISKAISKDSSLSIKHKRLAEITEMAFEINKTMPGLNLFPPAENKCSAAACNIGCPAPIKFFNSKTRSSRSFSTGCNSSVTVFIFTSITY